MSSLLHLETVKGIAHTLKQSPMMDSGAVSRTTRNYPSTAAVNSFTSNSVVSIVLPPVGHIDFAKSYVTGVLSFVGAGKLNGSIHSVFRRVQVVASNGVVLFDQDNYNTLAYTLQDLTLTADQQNTSLGIMSIMKQELRTSNLDLSFSFQPLISMLRSEKVIPLHYMGGITLNMFLEDPRVCFESAVDITYQVTKVKYVVDIITFNESVESLMRSAYEQDKLRFNFQAYRHLPFQSQSQVVDIRLEATDNSINGLLIAPRWANRLVDKTVDSFARTIGGPLTEIQYNVGSNLLAIQDATNGATGILMEVEKLLDSSNANTISPVEWSTHYAGGTGTKFCLGLHLNTVDDPAVLGGYSGKGQIVISCKHSSALANPIQYSSWILHDTTIMCGASNGTSILW